MVNIHAMRRTRQQNYVLVSNPERKTWIDFLLHSMGLLVSVLGPAFVVCFAGGSILLFAAIVFHDTLGATVGVMLYQNTTRAAAMSVVPSNQDEASNVQLRPAA